VSDDLTRKKNESTSTVDAYLRPAVWYLCQIIVDYIRDLTIDLSTVCQSTTSTILPLSTCPVGM
jgi:hypothetical protein